MITTISLSYEVQRKRSRNQSRQTGWSSARSVLMFSFMTRVPRVHGKVPRLSRLPPSIFTHQTFMLFHQLHQLHREDILSFLQAALQDAGICIGPVPHLRDAKTATIKQHLPLGQCPLHTTVIYHHHDI